MLESTLSPQLGTINLATASGGRSVTRFAVYVLIYVDSISDPPSISTPSESITSGVGQQVKNQQNNLLFLN